MPGIQSPPDYPDDMRDLFEDSEDENAEILGEQSLGPSTIESSGELEQADTKRKRSEDEINPMSLNEEEQEGLVCSFVVMSSSSVPDIRNRIRFERSLVKTLKLK